MDPMTSPLAAQHERFPAEFHALHPPHVREAIDRAAASMIGNVRRLMAERDGIAIERDRAELAGLGLDKPSDEWTEGVSERALELLGQMEWFDEIPRLVEELQENLWALGHLKVGAGMSEVEAAAQGWDPGLRVRLLSRFLWVVEDAKVVTPSGPETDVIFQCRVGRRTARVQHCEEFYSLLHFLPAYWQATGVEVVPIAKHERPDFLAEVAGSRRRIGIEMVEAVVQDTNENRAVCDEWTDEMRRSFPQGDATFSFHREAPFPRELKRQKGKFLAFVGQVLENERDDGRQRFKFKHDGKVLVDFTVSRREPGSGLLFSYPVGDYAWPGDSPERHVAASVVRAVNHKLKNKQPELPSMLVVYPNDPVPGANEATVAAYVYPDLALGARGAFESVWMSDSTGLHRLDVPGAVVDL